MAETIPGPIFESWSSSPLRGLQEPVFFFFFNSPGKACDRGEFSDTA